MLINISQTISSLVQNLGLLELHVNKHETHIIYHFLDRKRTQQRIISTVAEALKEAYLPLGDFFIIIGKTVLGCSNAFDSYSSAVILSQRAFFLPYHTIISSELFPEPENHFLIDPMCHFQECLSNLSKEKMQNELASLLETMQNSYFLLPAQVKDIYYKLFMVIQSHYKKYQLNLYAIGSDSDSIMGYVEPCISLSQLHSKLAEKVDLFFCDLKNYQPENPMVFSIKEYISGNYRNETLSVKDISEHVNLSTSYMCTFFKSETGQTINQYLTEFRIQKAKELLLDATYKITDISSKVGYSDGNYFGKIFKKIVGMSPSEFREKMLT